MSQSLKTIIREEYVPPLFCTSLGATSDDVPGAKSIQTPVCKLEVVAEMIRWKFHHLLFCGPTTKFIACNSLVQIAADPFMCPCNPNAIDVDRSLSKDSAFVVKSFMVV